MKCAFMSPVKKVHFFLTHHYDYTIRSAGLRGRAGLEVIRLSEILGFATS